MIIENENKHLIVCTHLHIQNSEFRKKKKTTLEKE